MQKILMAVLVLITGVSVGLTLHTQQQLREARATRAVAPVERPVADIPAPPAPRPAPVIADESAQRIEALQRQVSALQADRVRLQAELASAQSAANLRDTVAINPIAAPASVSTNAPRRAPFDARMEQLKREDPVRYAEMQKQREEFRQRMEAQADERSEFLKNVDTVRMTDEQRANHEKLVETVDQVRALMAQLPNLPPEEATALRQQLAQTAGVVSDLYQKERRYLLVQTGRAMGYADAESTQFADYIQQIYDQTAMPRGLGGRGNRNSGATRTPTGTATGTGTTTPAPAAR
jgi:hypothetical protein